MKTMIRETMISRDDARKKLLVVREFDASPEKVWKAWTDKSILDQWWAPKPWKAVTKTLDFREGGHWLYYMQGPEGEKQYCRFDYQTIDPQKSFSGTDAFCDEQGNQTHEFPSMQWLNKFSPSDTGTRVEVEISFESLDDLEKIVEMGFKEGFTAAHGNLDEILAG